MTTLEIILLIYSTLVSSACGWFFVGWQKNIDRLIITNHRLLLAKDLLRRMKAHFGMHVGFSKKCVTCSELLKMAENQTE